MLKCPNCDSRDIARTESQHPTLDMWHVEKLCNNCNHRWVDHLEWERDWSKMPGETSGNEQTS